MTNRDLILEMEEDIKDLKEIIRTISKKIDEIEANIDELENNYLMLDNKIDDVQTENAYTNDDLETRIGFLETEIM